MRRYDADERIPTLDVAVSEFMNAEDLKRLGALTGERLPTRKADLAQVTELGFGAFFAASTEPGRGAI
ncbi:MAG: hypothetical protein WB795_10990 [Candidatus Acidiferrales bacterium]|jgi:hypothetical protein